MRDWGQKRAIVSTAPMPGGPDAFGGPNTLSPGPRPPGATPLAPPRLTTPMAARPEKAPEPLGLPEVDKALGPAPQAPTPGTNAPVRGLGGNPYGLPFPQNLMASGASKALGTISKNPVQDVQKGLAQVASGDPAGAMNKGFKALGGGVDALGQGVNTVDKRLAATQQAGIQGQKNLDAFDTPGGAWLPAGLALGGAGLGA